MRGWLFEKARKLTAVAVGAMRRVCCWRVGPLEVVGF